MIAASDFLAALECTKFVFGRALPRTTRGELTGPFVGLRGPTSKGGEGRDRRKGRKGREGGTGRPLRQFVDTPPIIAPRPKIVKHRQIKKKSNNHGALMPMYYRKEKESGFV